MNEMGPEGSEEVRLLEVFATRESGCEDGVCPQLERKSEDYLPSVVGSHRLLGYFRLHFTKGKECTFALMYSWTAIHKATRLGGGPSV